MPTITLMRGLPGSGKTSRAESVYQHIPRISRDVIRRILHADPDYYYHPHLTKQARIAAEQRVTDLQTVMIRHIIAAGNDVVIDDTNLRGQDIDHWRALAADLGADVVFDDACMATPVEECIRRQSARPHGERVPGDAILRMSRNAGLLDGMAAEEIETLTALAFGRWPPCGGCSPPKP